MPLGYTTFKMELATGFEPVSTDYKSAILPIELCKLGAGTGIEPVSQAYETCQLTFCYILQWSHGAELNHRHEDFQSSALPTELPCENGDP